MDRPVDRPRTSVAALVAAVIALAVVIAVPPVEAVAASRASRTTTATPAPADDGVGTYLGVFRETAPLTAADGFRADTGVEAASVQWFEAWSNERPFPVAEARALWDRGILPHWTWEPWDPRLAVTDPAQIDLRDVVDGRWDAYISARGAELASLGTPVLVRWGHEFNGDWYPWAVSRNGQDPQLYVAAYRHVHDLVTAAGATNVQWMWTFNAGSSPDAAWNAPARAYPGDAYVDWVGIDGYNWGYGPSWDPAGDHWTSFDGVVGVAYATATQIAPTKPVAVAETASSEDGGDKAAWLRTMLADLAAGRYPRVRLVNYFDELKEEAWAFGSSGTARDAYVTGIRDPWFAGTGRDLAVVARPSSPTPTASPAPTTSPAPSAPPAPTVTPAPTAGPSTCTATLTVVSTWQGGFHADVAVTAASALTGWRTTFTLPPGVKLTETWNGVFATSGRTVTVRNAAWNGTVEAGATTLLGFVATGTAPTGPVPVTCS